MGSFSASIRDWADDTLMALEAIMRQSTLDVVRLMQRTVGEGGNMPFDTGFLRKSLMGSTSHMPVLSEENPGGSYAYNESQIALVVAGAKLGDTIYIGYTAVYAARMEYGFVGWDSMGRYYQQEGRAFVRKAAQQWPHIVARNEAILSARMAFS